MTADLQILNALSGDMAIDAWLAVSGDWVEEPNERRGGLSGVKRVSSKEGMLYCKQQSGHIYRSLRHPFGYPTAMRERDALRDCLRLQVPVPALVFAACRKRPEGWQAVLVTEALDGFSSLEQCYLEKRELAWGEPLHLEILQEVGRVLGLLNSGRRQHGCLYLKHVFVRLQAGRVEVSLIDLEKSRLRLTRRQASRHDLRQIARRSPWSRVQWQALLEGYRSSFGEELVVPERG